MKNKVYYLEDDEYMLPIPEEIKKQIISDHLEKYYIGSLVTGVFIIGFLLGVLAYAL